MDPTLEASALTQTEDALRELVQAAVNIGLNKASLRLMLLNVADDMKPPEVKVVQ